MKAAKLKQYLIHIIPTASEKLVGITFIQDQLEKPNATESPHKANNNPAMTQVQESPYGTWESPITPDHFASGSVILDQLDVNAVYDLDPSTGDTKILVHEDRKLYYADFAIPPDDQRWIVAIQENHHADDPVAVENKIVALLIADWDNGQVSNITSIAGVDIDSSVTQPCWGVDNTLYYVDDKSGYWQLYEYSNGHSRHLKLSDLEDAEFCFTDFFLGAASYAPLSPDTIVSFYTKNGTYTSIVIDTKTCNYRELQCPITDILTNAIKAVSSTAVAIIGSTASSPQVLTVVDINQGGLGQVLKRSAATELPEDYVSHATHVTFPRVTGSGGGVAHGLFLLPKNPKFKCDGSLPPLIVSVHGGPTCQAGPGFYLRDQALTTRGYAVLQVNYVGSTGYGKKYRQLLNGQWGVSDIADAVSAVDYLARQNLIDRQRVGLTGHSAGGFLTMQGMRIKNEFF
ncbi:hypothetical protein TrVFT333_006517 [Trichoderma virens FT-333]|nr:hypothetical protein TrVFT333_006517 [Trichoderma virens FT-333]